MGKKLKDFGNSVFTGLTESILGLIGSIKTLVSNPRGLVLFLVLCSFSYDFATGGKLGSINFIAGKIKELFDISKEITPWQAVTILGSFGIGYLIFDKIKK
jgi:hypothetical protein